MQALLRYGGYVAAAQMGAQLQLVHSVDPPDYTPDTCKTSIYCQLAYFNRQVNKTDAVDSSSVTCQ